MLILLFYCDFCIYISIITIHFMIFYYYFLLLFSVYYCLLEIFLIICLHLLSVFLSHFYFFGLY